MAGISPNDNTKLVEYLRENPQGDPSFPDHEVDYYDRFRRIDEHLNKVVHPTVNQGATANRDGWLTDHGHRHITTVIRRASDLAFSQEQTFLSPYEVFVLLLAIHFHDTGNIFGRDEHEKKIAVVMQDMDNSLLGDDAIEKRMVRDIAMAHGGYFNKQTQDRDTIGPLRWDRTLPPRVQLLAAILRFADELADDHTRTSRFLINNGLITRGSEVYHLYADRLQRVQVRSDDDAIDLSFQLDVSHVVTKYWKGRKKVYLFDEIVDRSLKMCREHIYCLRFLQPHVTIDTINVSITISTDNYFKVLEILIFQMKQRGYPDFPAKLADVDADFATLTGKKLHTKFSKSRTAKSNDTSKS